MTTTATSPTPEQLLLLPAPDPSPDGALIEHHLVRCIQDGSVPVRRLAALLGVSRATLYKIAAGGGASVALLVKFGAMVGTLYPETCEDALRALGLDAALGEGWKLRGQVRVQRTVVTGYEVEIRTNTTQIQIVDAPALPPLTVCPKCCADAIAAGIVVPGEVCQGCEGCGEIGS